MPCASQSQVRPRALHQPRPAARAVALVVAAGLALTLSPPGRAQTAAPPPSPGAPAAEQRIFIVGDSLGELVSAALKKELRNRAGTAVESFISLGSGLARSDLFDWPKKVRAVMATFKPNRVVVIIGGADNQKMMSGSELFTFGTTGWNTEYARRVREIMDIIREGGVKTMLWIGLPDVRDPQMNRDLKIITGIFATQAAARPGCHYLDTTRLFSATPGQYSAYVIKQDGMPLSVRSTDGKHFNSAGAELLAQTIIARLDQEP
ncbi:MAG: DUF459 domain-containing protein [Kiritimatiellaeota bacterium]|nr:DUF459 domain-containing protein [Kiritimatiellota bacterium]